MKNNNNYNNGFTLVELITVMVITGIISMLVVNIITTPMKSFSDMKRRAELVDIAELTLHRMNRAIHHALPNSIRISSDARTIELLHTIAGGRYDKNSFDITQTTAFIDPLKPLSNLSDISVDAGETNNTRCGRLNESNCLVVYNLGNGINDADAYRGGNISALKTKSATQLTFVDHHFTLNSPQQRFMIVDKAQIFSCNLGTGKLWLSENYNFSDTDNEPPVFSGDHLLANHISNCRFTYNPGTLTRPALVTLQIEISAQGERVNLLQQAFVENQP